MNFFRWLASGIRNCFVSREHSGPESRICVTNQTRNTVLASCMEVADTAAKRNKGLLGRERLAPGEGLWIIPCESVHTFWMRFPIDLVYLDRKKNIRKLKSSVPAWRLSACLRAHSVIELPSGTIDQTQTRVGDILEFSPATAFVAEGENSARN
jgi:hypothetical protein